MVESVRRVVKISKVIIKAKIDIMLQGTRKRHLPTSEFSGKFDCKQDFMKYFKEQCKDLTNLTMNVQCNYIFRAILWSTRTSLNRSLPKIKNYSRSKMCVS